MHLLKLGSPYMPVQFSIFRRFQGVLGVLQLDLLVTARTESLLHSYRQEDAQHGTRIIERPYQVGTQITQKLARNMEYYFIEWELFLTPLPYVSIDHKDHICGGKAPDRRCEFKIIYIQVFLIISLFLVEAMCFPMDISLCLSFSRFRPLRYTQFHSASGRYF